VIIGMSDGGKLEQICRSTSFLPRHGNYYSSFFPSVLSASSFLSPTMQRQDRRNGQSLSFVSFQKRNWGRFGGPPLSPVVEDVFFTWAPFLASLRTAHTVSVVDIRIEIPL
jgi:hypothetical protein